MFWPFATETSSAYLDLWILSQELHMQVMHIVIQILILAFLFMLLMQRYFFNIFPDTMLEISLFLVVFLKVLFPYEGGSEDNVELIS
jgi:hypothetical protein